MRSLRGRGVGVLMLGGGREPFAEHIELGHALEVRCERLLRTARAWSAGASSHVRVSTTAAALVRHARNPPKELTVATEAAPFNRASAERSVRRW